MWGEETRGEKGRIRVERVARCCLDMGVHVRVWW